LKTKRSKQVADHEDEGSALLQNILNIYQTTQHYIPEDGSLQIHPHEYIKSHICPLIWSLVTIEIEATSLINLTISQTSLISLAEYTSTLVPGDHKPMCSQVLGTWFYLMLYMIRGHAVA
jgi:hypothetical protein